MGEPSLRSKVQTERTEVFTHDRGQGSHTDRLSSVNKLFIIWQKKKNLIRSVTTTLLVNSDEHNLILPKFALLFLSSAF